MKSLLLYCLKEHHYNVKGNITMSFKKKNHKLNTQRIKLGIYSHLNILQFEHLAKMATHKPEIKSAFSNMA